jgi:hypothetical protein
MLYPEKLLKQIEEAIERVNLMIKAAEKQGALNFQALYNLQKGLDDFLFIVKNNLDLSASFIENWNNLYRWVPRFFDGDAFLTLLNDISKYVPLSRTIKA